MRDFTKNMGYFLGEVRTILLLNGFSSLLSLVSLILIFFVALLALGGWWVSADFVKALRNEAEISVYYSEALNPAAVDRLKTNISAVPGVTSVTAVDAAESYERMSAILGQDAKILGYLDENPFEAYFEVGIQLEKLDAVMKALEGMPDAEYVRDNQTVLQKLSAIASAVTALGIVTAGAVGISTFIITSHIIREGVHSHRGQISTLRLLGAPDWFIHAPFIMEGVLLTLMAAAFAGVLFTAFLGRMGAMLSVSVPFMPPVAYGTMIQTLLAGLMIASVLTGLLASLFGLKMVRTR